MMPRVIDRADSFTGNCFGSPQDDEECKDEGVCSHGCEEQKGSYRCTCLPGYRLLVDRTTCKREGKIQSSLKEFILNLH